MPREAVAQETNLLEKKEQGICPALKIVSTLFPEKFGFDFDLRGDAASARQGSSRDLDHQTASLRPA
jgi:hypothetical protein